MRPAERKTTETIRFDLEIFMLPLRWLNMAQVHIEISPGPGKKQNFPGISKPATCGSEIPIIFDFFRWLLFMVANEAESFLSFGDLALFADLCRAELRFGLAFARSREHAKP